MLGYTEMEWAGLKILSKNVIVSNRSVKIPINITAVISKGGPCVLTQSRASIQPGLLFTSKASGLNRSVEDTSQKCVRELLMTNHVADHADDAFFQSVRPLLQSVPILPAERISTLVVLIATSPDIRFTDKLGHQMKLSNCLLVPAKGMDVLVTSADKLETWLKAIEEAVGLKCSFSKSPE